MVTNRVNFKRKRNKDISEKMPLKRFKTRNFILNLFKNHRKIKRKYIITASKMRCQRGLKVCSNVTLSKFAHIKKCISLCRYY